MHHKVLLQSAIAALRPAMALLIICLALTTIANAAEPAVTVLPLDTSGAGKFRYVGPAVKQMLISRLASEKLRIISPNAGHEGAAQDKETPGNTEADYIVAGKITAHQGNEINIHLELKTPDSDTPVTQWDIEPGPINNIIPEIGRYSIEIAQAINDQVDRKAIFSGFSSLGENVEKNEDSLIKDEELRLARMHPDRLYRETPASQKGTAPIDHVPDDTVNKQNSPDKDSAGTTEVSSEHGPESGEGGVEDEDQWQPDYPPEYTDEPVGENKKDDILVKGEHDNDSAISATGETAEHQQKAQKEDMRKAASAKDRSGWSSRLWPFHKEEKPRAMPAPVPEDKLPYPVPRDIDHPPEAVTEQAPDTLSLASLRPAGGAVYAPEAIAPAQNGQAISPAVSATGPESEAARADTEEVLNIQDDIINANAGNTAPGEETSPGNEGADTVPGSSAGHATQGEDAIDLQAGVADTEKAGQEETGGKTNHASLSPGMHEQEQELNITRQPNPLPTGTPEADTPAQPAGRQSMQAAASISTAALPPSRKMTSDGWFSWLWPESWKGGADESVRQTAMAKPAIRLEEQDENNAKNDTDTYHSASEPAPVKGKKTGPVWVWN